jgi:hypothetical protein
MDNGAATVQVFPLPFRVSVAKYTDASVMTARMIM